MDKVKRLDILDLNRYEARRDEIRRQVIQSKRLRRISLGNNMSLLFENKESVFYQIMEMIRTEKIENENEILHEINTYNPLIPDGNNLKATLLIEYPDDDERNRCLKLLKDVEHQVRFKVDGRQAHYAIADEDMERSDSEVTSTVHFLCFNFDGDDIEALKSGAHLAFSINHSFYNTESILDKSTCDALVQDFH